MGQIKVTHGEEQALAAILERQILSAMDNAQHLTIIAALGALEMVKTSLIQMYYEHHRGRGNGGSPGIVVPGAAIAQKLKVRNPDK